MDAYLAVQTAPGFQLVPPWQAIPSRPFVRPWGARILRGTGGAPSNGGTATTARRSSPQYRSTPATRRVIVRTPGTRAPTRTPVTEPPEDDPPVDEDEP